MYTFSCTIQLLTLQELPSIPGVLVMMAIHPQRVPQRTFASEKSGPEARQSRRWSMFRRVRRTCVQA
jgi:hypothetical protein